MPATKVPVEALQRLHEREANTFIPFADSGLTMDSNTITLASRESHEGVA